MNQGGEQQQNSPLSAPRGLIVPGVTLSLPPSQLGPGRPLPTFPTSECTSDVEPDTREMVRAQNKKKKKSGGFQSMGRCTRRPGTGGVAAGTHHALCALGLSALGLALW